MPSKVYSSEDKGTKAFAGESVFNDPQFAVFDVAFREWGGFPSPDEKYIVVDTENETACVVQVNGADAEVASL